MGGAERLAVSFAREAVASGIDLRVCCLKRIGGNPLESPLRGTGVRFDLLDAANLRDRRAFARLRQLLRQERIDIIHAHLMYATIWGVAAARLEAVPCVATLHVAPASGPAWSRQRIRERLMCGLLNRTRTTVVAVSASLRDRYLQRRLLNPSRVVVVPNGVDVERSPMRNAGAAARLRTGFALPPDARVLMATAVLRGPGKGLHVLLDALPQVIAACPGARLVVIGDGPSRAGLQARARQLGIETAVRWAGARDDVPALLAGAEIFVHPTLDDPFPTAVLEAMSAGLPIVATGVDGIPEMIDAGHSGRLVPPSDAAALASALTELLADAGVRGALGTAARRTALERFSTAVWVRTLRQLYQRALAASAGLEQSGRAPMVAAP